MQFSSLDEQLRFAIAHKRLIEVTYSGASRVAEPHDYGVNKGLPRLLAYQLRQNGAPRSNKTTGWRLFDIAKITGCVVQQTTFPGSRGDAHERHYEWDPLYARVT